MKKKKNENPYVVWCEPSLHVRFFHTFALDIFGFSVFYSVKSISSNFCFDRILLILNRKKTIYNLVCQTLRIRKKRENFSRKFNSIHYQHERLFEPTFIWSKHKSMTTYPYRYTHTERQNAIVQTRYIHRVQSSVGSERIIVCFVTVRYTFTLTR